LTGRAAAHQPVRPSGDDHPVAAIVRSAFLVGVRVADSFDLL
jgi:hypothetical protein